MVHHFWPILVVVLANVVYNISTKFTPPAANAFLSLAVTYLVAAVCSILLYLTQGEHQKLGSALAQQTEMIVLDEPTNHLDIGAQIKTLRLLKHSGKTILAVLHDLTLAARFCDRLYALYQGRLYAQGTPKQIITPELLWKLYRAKAEVFDRNGRLCIEFL